MKNVYLNISDESYKLITNYKTDNNIKRLEEALDLILKDYSILKGGKRK